MRLPRRDAPTGWDLSPDGRTLAVLGHAPWSAPVVHLIDVATGARRLVHAEPHAGRTDLALFTSDGGELITVIDHRIRRLDLATGTMRTIAECRPGVIGGRHPERFVPAFDAARRRMLVFDADDRAKVLDVDGTSLLEVPVRADCRVRALSPSGRLLALGHAESHVVEVWDVDTGERLSRARFPFPGPGPSPDRFDRIAFHPGEHTLLAFRSPCDGPFAMALGGGELVWAYDVEPRAWPAAHGWAFTPDGKRLVVAPWGEPGRPGAVEFRDAETYAPVGEPVATPRQPVRTVFSADGSRMACGADQGTISVHALAP